MANNDTTYSYEFLVLVANWFICNKRLQDQQVINRGLFISMNTSITKFNNYRIIEPTNNTRYAHSESLNNTHEHSKLRVEKTKSEVLYYEKAKELNEIEIEKATTYRDIITMIETENISLPINVNHPVLGYLNIEECNSNKVMENLVILQNKLEDSINKHLSAINRHEEAKTIERQKYRIMEEEYYRQCGR